MGPTGAGAPFHYHENALNALLHGRKRWWLKEPSDAVYSVRHPRAWTDDTKDACTFVQHAGDVVLVPANWAHAILNEAPVVGAAFEHLDSYLICPVPLTVRGTQVLVGFAPLAPSVFCAASRRFALKPGLDFHLINGIPKSLGCFLKITKDAWPMLKDFKLIYKTWVRF